jgi:ParB-like nuclease domain
MNFENRPTHSLRPYARSARTHSPKQIKQIARSIERFGFNNPVLIDDEDQIIAGHGRLLAAKQLNMKTDAARSKAREIIGQSPQHGLLPVIENWRQLPDGQIEFAIRNFPTPD